MLARSDFTSVEDALPREGWPVLVLRESGTIICQYEVITARYYPSYRPLNPWQTINNDSVTDSGSEVIAWTYADMLLLPPITRSEEN
jgi:hypothetical protein